MVHRDERPVRWPKKKGKCKHGENALSTRHFSKSLVARSIRTTASSCKQSPDPQPFAPRSFELNRKALRPGCFRCIATRQVLAMHSHQLERSRALWRDARQWPHDPRATLGSQFVNQGCDFPHPVKLSGLARALKSPGGGSRSTRARQDQGP